jgi:chromosome segregation ATPase
MPETNTTPATDDEIRKAAKVASAEIAKLDAARQAAEQSAATATAAFETAPDEKTAIAERVASQVHTNTVAALEAAKERHAVTLSLATDVQRAETYRANVKRLGELGCAIREHRDAIIGMDPTLRKHVAAIAELVDEQAALAETTNRIGESCRRLSGEREYQGPLSIGVVRNEVERTLGDRNHVGTTRAAPRVHQWLAGSGEYATPVI